MRTLRLLLSLPVVLSLPLFASLDGSISGVVRDGTGSALSGVTVEIRGPVLLGARTAVSRNDGSFRFPGLPPGDGYSLGFRLAGFRPARAEEISVNLGLDTQLNVTLPLEAVSAEVVVTDAAPLVDVTQTATTTSFGIKHLRDLSLGARARTYQQVLSQAAAVTEIAGSEGTPFHQISGGSLVENAYLVDGVTNTDPVDHMWSINLTFDSIQEVSLQSSSFLPEYGRATGGVVSVVTKSGGNELHGSGDLRWASSDLAGRGDRFDPDRTPYRASPWSVTLGGPFARDAVWFFGSFHRVDDVRTPFTDDPIILEQVPDPADRRSDGWFGGAKVSFLAGERWNGFASWSGYSNTVDNIWGLVDIWRPEAAILAVNEATQGTVKANGSLSDRWLAEVQAGWSTSFYDYGPTGKGDEVSSWLNVAGQGVRYDNHFVHWISDRDRRFAAASATWFFEGGVGSHELKGGIYSEKTHLDDLYIYTGRPTNPAYCTPEPGVRGAPEGATCSARFLFDGFDGQGTRIPLLQQISENQPPLPFGGRAFSLYLQDQWRPTARLTVNAGLRWDRNEYFNNEGRSVATLEKLQPRLSAAFDLTGDGRTVARTSWGLFYLDAPLSFMSNAVTGLTPPYSAAYEWLPATDSWSLIPGSESGGVGSGVLETPPIEGPLRPIHEEQINIALQREVVRGLSVSGTYAYKKAKDLFDNTCSDYDGCPFFWISNEPGRSLGLEDQLRRSFYAWTVEATWQDPGGRGLAAASYSYSKARGSLELAEFFGSSPDFDFHPYQFVNRFGYLASDVRHQLKVSASFRVPTIETNVAVTYLYRTGKPWTPWDYDEIGWGHIYLESRGSRRTPALHSIDLQLEKRFALDGVAEDLSVSALATVYNLLGSETATTIESYVGSELFGQPTVWTQPRALELGLRMEF